MNGLAAVERGSNIKLMDMPPPAPPPAHIIVINCDDLGYGDLGCYGSILNRTPALDRLAREGTRFTNFLMASSICTPSRAALLTGCYPQRISMNKVLFPGAPEGINPDEETIASMLKKNGYRTAIIGKWHLGDQPAFMPGRLGFDYYFGLPYSNDMGIQKGSANAVPLPLLQDDGILELQPDQTSLTERYVEEATRFIEDSAASGIPFFLYFSHMYVHHPLYVPEEFMRNSLNGRYGGAVACIDWAWDQLDKVLSRLGLENNTLVLFTSDNGCRAGDGFGSNAPFKGGKFSTWEGGFRLPLIARWPERVPAGEVNDCLISSIDLLPTLAAMTGAEAQRIKPIDGINQAALFTAKSTQSVREYFAYFSNGNLAAVRNRKWKLHFCISQGWGRTFAGFQALYDLENDPGETVDLAGQHPEVVRELNEFANRIRRELGDTFTSTTGEMVRPCGVAQDPVPLVIEADSAAYVIAEYDLADRG